jgi:hypothetical protein
MRSVRGTLRVPRTGAAEWHPRVRGRAMRALEHAAAADGRCGEKTRLRVRR